MRMMYEQRMKGKFHTQLRISESLADDGPSGPCAFETKKNAAQLSIVYDKV